MINGKLKGSGPFTNTEHTEMTEKNNNIKQYFKDVPCGQKGLLETVHV